MGPDDWERINFALDMIKDTDYYKRRHEDWDFSITHGVASIEQALAGDEWV